MTQSSCKRDTKSKSNVGMKLAPLRVSHLSTPLNGASINFFLHRVTKKTAFVLANHNRNFFSCILIVHKQLSIEVYILYCFLLCKNMGS